ncbi:carbohydrate esterase family 9 protein [Metarhizium album ARSEF 1941]|uniref:Carbohydrate esterase family 9 protein n=1 Tax=Metarhizium album (strain ARSEF 1941) TaxID=1081103 RepID=A0A0B2WNB3_METAS|nr:carbohydrate esterase family 9 protein [Metarhizium album ARSEF 1941]KHN97551.1 carbohydrate esterase family 9 protein [Metarhizium album ARSEF 1941]
MPDLATDDKHCLPPYTLYAPHSPPRVRPDFRRPPGNNGGRLRLRRGLRRSRGIKFLVAACLSLLVLAQWRQIWRSSRRSVKLKLSAQKLQENLATCKKLQQRPRDPIGLGRDKNARFVDGGRPTLIKNATIWIGEPVEGTGNEDARAGKGWQWIKADVYLEHGLVNKVEPHIPLSRLPKDTHLYNAAGRLLTSGIIDMHSHAGVASLPNLRGNSDDNESSSPVTPWARAIDALYVLDPQIEVIKSGGVTTSLILPGSSNNIAGEAYLIKHAVGGKAGRREISAADVLADPDRHWRYMKMACGENPKSSSSSSGRMASRLGESFEFRRAFETARNLVQKQDDWCDKAQAVGVDNMHDYLPEDLAWESLAAAMRGQVHVNTHCYTVPDLEAMVDHTNEFKFAILKRTWGGRPPASALFADNMYYKVEAYVGSESAGKILYEHGLTPVYVSDHPILNAQHVLFEAAKAYHYGLPYHAALASVTTAPAEELGMGQRLGKVKPGFDADVVVWDSDPLSVGATPVQVWIDGTAQFTAPVYLEKPIQGPIGPSATLADIVPEPTRIADALFQGVTKVLLSGDDAHSIDGEPHNVVVTKGHITCIGSCESEFEVAIAAGVKVVRLNNGYLTHSFTGVGGTIGLNAIDAEDSTDNGDNKETFTRAVDGLQLDNKKLRVGARFGVTRAISAPKFNGLKTHHGTSVGFETTALTSLEKGAVFAEDAAVHYTLDVNARMAADKSYSGAFGSLRKKLLGAAKADKEPDAYSEEAYLKRVVSGDLVLALTINSADGIAAALRIKSEVEGLLKSRIRMAIIGGAESYLVATELAAASVGVILQPLQPLPLTWDQRRALPGAPLTNCTAADWLVTAGVMVAVGLPEDWYVRDLGFEAGTAYRNGNGRFTEKSALDLVSRNIYKILGLEVDEDEDRGHFVISEGSPLEIGTRIRAVAAGNGRLSVFA